MINIGMVFFRHVWKGFLIGFFFLFISQHPIMAQDFLFVDQVIDYNDPNPRMIDAGDFDSDGDVDFVITYFNQSGLTSVALFIPYNNGILKSVIDNTLVLTYDVEVADIDGDGKLDFIVSESAGRIIWYQNLTGVTFSKNIIGSGLNDPRELEIVDFDGDGDLDVIASSPAVQDIYWLKNDGSQNFTLVNIPAGSTTWGLKVVDLDQNGVMDILANRDVAGDVIWITTTDFNSFQSTVLYSGLGYSFDVNAGDLGADGDMDVVITDGNNGEVIALINDGSQNFTSQIIDSNLPGADNVDIADMNNDGIPDIVATAWGNTVTDGIYVYDGNNNFQKITIMNNLKGGAGFVIIDTDGDGDKDIVSSFYKEPKVVQFFNLKTKSIDPYYIISPANLNFGAIAIGSQSSMTAEIKNIGQSDLVVSSVGTAGSFTADNYTGTIAAGGSTTLNVNFSPTSTLQENATLVVYSNGSGRNANLSGKGYEPYITLSENFDATVILPEGWSYLIENNSNAVVKVLDYSPYAHSLNKFLYIRNYSETTGNVVGISPALKRSSKGNVLKFWARTGTGNGTQNFHIGTLSDPTNLSTFQLLQTIQPSETYQEFSITIPPGSGFIYIAFKHSLEQTNVRYCVDDFSWTEMDNSLPVSLASFTVSGADGKVILRWVTESETDNLGYEVYRSNQKDEGYQLLSSFESNPALKGAGNSNTRNVYRFEDSTVINGRQYWYKIADVDVNGQRHFHGPRSVIPNKAPLSKIKENIPERFDLKENYPNPFNPTTTIEFDVPRVFKGNTTIHLAIFNTLGQKIKTLVNASLGPGTYRVRWDGTNENGETVSSGIYLYGIQSEYYVRFRKMILMR